MITLLTILFCFATMLFVSVLKRKFLEPLAIPVLAIGQFVVAMFIFTNLFHVGMVSAMLYSMLSIWVLYFVWAGSAVRHIRQR